MLPPFLPIFEKYLETSGGTLLRLREERFRAAMDQHSNTNSSYVYYIMIGILLLPAAGKRQCYGAEAAIFFNLLLPAVGSSIEIEA
jgi:hypothetical protein